MEELDRENFMSLIYDMIEPDKDARKKSENVFLNWPLMKRIYTMRKCTITDCLRDVRPPLPKEMIFANIVYYIHRKELIDAIYPRLAAEKKSFCGRNIGVYEEQHEFIQNYSSNVDPSYSDLQYKAFDEIAARGSRTTRRILGAFFLGLRRHGFLGMKGSLLKYLMSHLNFLDSSLYRFENELDATFRTILSLPMRQGSPKILSLKATILEVSAALLNRQINRKDDSLISTFNKLMISALKEVRMSLKDADKISIKKLAKVEFTNFRIVAMVNPQYLLPSCQDIYGITIEVMSWKCLSCDRIKPAFFEMFVTFAENCPEEIKCIGQKEYKLCTKNKTLTYEECLIKNVINRITRANHDHKMLEISYYTSIEEHVTYRDIELGDALRARSFRMIEIARNLVRLARVVGTKKIWSHIQNLLKGIRSPQNWQSIYAALIMISYLGDICKDEITASHKLIENALSLACDSYTCKLVSIAMCLVNVQLAIDIGQSFVRSWQCEEYMSTLVLLTQAPGRQCSLQRVFALRAITSCAENEFPVIQNPVFKKYLPKMFDAITKFLHRDIPQGFDIDAIEVRIHAVKALCALVKAGAGKRLVTNEQIKCCRSAIYKHIDEHSFQATGGYEFRNMTDIQLVFFGALFQLLDYGHRPSSVRLIRRCLRRCMASEFHSKFHLEFYDPPYRRVSARTYPCSAVAVLANTSPSSLNIFKDIILSNIHHIPQLAGTEYLEIFNEYSRYSFADDAKITDGMFVTAEECIKGKENACRLILNLAKYQCDYLEGVRLKKVIDTILTNLTDRMCSATQELASEALPFLLEIFMQKNYIIFSWCMYRRILRCFMKAASNQINPFKCLRLLLKMMEIHKKFERPGINSRLMDKIVNNFVLQKLKYADNFIANHRRGNIINDFVMSKASHMEEINKLTTEVRKMLLQETI